MDRQKFTTFLNDLLKNFRFTSFERDVRVGIYIIYKNLLKDWVEAPLSNSCKLPLFKRFYSC